MKRLLQAVAMALALIMLTTTVQLPVMALEQTGPPRLKNIPLVTNDKTGWEFAYTYGIWEGNGSLKLEKDADNGSNPAYKITSTTTNGSIQFVPNGWQGFSLEAYEPNGAIEFDVKGQSGGEDFSIGLKSSRYGNVQTVDKKVSALGVNVTTGWTHYRIPLTSIIAGAPSGFTIENVTEIYIGPGGTKTFYISEFYITSPDSETQFAIIKPNQIGYESGDVKCAMVSAFDTDLSGERFDVISTADGLSKYDGVLSNGRTDNALSGENVFKADFSILKTEGTYFIRIAGVDDSPEFTIGADVYKDVLYDTLRYYYYQRQSKNGLTEPYAEGFARPNVTRTPDQSVKLYSQRDNSSATVYDMSGGWYDAGDVGKYVVPGSAAAADLLFMYELFHEMAPDLYGYNNNIPESENDIPDILDEAKYELDFILKMRDEATGGFYDLVPEPAMTSGRDQGDKRWIMDVQDFSAGSKISTPSTAASVSAAAALAHAYIAFEDIDPSYAQTCLAAAEDAWVFADSQGSNYTGAYIGTPGVDGGLPYATKDANDINGMKLWAAGVLYRATRNSEYNTYFKANYKSTSEALEIFNGWVKPAGERAMWGYLNYLMADNYDSGAYDYFSYEFNTKQNSFKSILSGYFGDPWGVGIGSWMFYWSSTCPLNYAPVMVYLGNKVLGITGANDKSAEYSRNTLNYMLGANPLAFSFVSGQGENSVKRIFSSVYPLSGTAVPNGYVPGGANGSGGGDYSFMTHYPAKGYIDSDTNFTVNENAIYYTSSFLFNLSLAMATANVEYTVTPKAATGGTVTGGGMTKKGTSVTLKAAASSGYEFEGWYDGKGTKIENAGAEYTFTPSASGTLTAQFASAANVAVDLEKKRISAVGAEFRVYNGTTKIWMNGANVPWGNDKGAGAWNAFGGNYNEAWWDAEFKRLKNEGLNSVRVWMNCDGNGSISISSDGTVTAVSNKHWEDLDSLFEIAKNNEIYVLATLISFDHFKTANKNGASWQAMVKNSAKMDTFVSTYTIPFVERYGDNPYLWAIDICNEIDWLKEDAACGGQITWANIQQFVAKNAAAIHKNSKVLVTEGMGAGCKFNGTNNGDSVNYLLDSTLMAYDSEGYLDFWSPHYYEWIGAWYWDPFSRTPSTWMGTAAGTSKPSVIAECPAVGSDKILTTGGNYTKQTKTIVDNYKDAYGNGSSWQGILPWSANGIDGAGNLEDMKAGANYIAAEYPQYVYPVDPEAGFVAVTSIDAVAKTMTAGTPLTLFGVADPSNATNKKITWELLDKGSTDATFSNGTISATTTGTIKVRATVVNGATSTSNYTEDFDVQVTYVATTGITGVEALISVGETSLDATVAPNNASYKKIVWSIANAGGTGATISGNKLKVTTEGVVTVRATIANGTTSTSNYTQDFDIVVERQPIWTSPDSGGTNLLAWGANNTDYMFFKTDGAGTKGTDIPNLNSLLVSGTALKVTYTGAAPYVMTNSYSDPKGTRVDSSATVTGSPYNIAYYTYDALRASCTGEFRALNFGVATACNVFEVDIVKYTLGSSNVTINVSASTGGTASGGGSGVTYGSNVTVTATANSGYVFDGWYEGSSLVSLQAAYTFTANANRTLQARFAVEVPKTYTATLNVRKDGSAWSDHGKTYTLKLSGNETTTASMTGTGTLTATVGNGTWKIYDGTTDTGTTIVISNSANNTSLNYYTILYNVLDVPYASGCTISATYDGKAIANGAVVLGGKALVITAVGHGSSPMNYTYSWIGTGSGTTDTYSVAAVNALVNVQCQVTGTYRALTGTATIDKTSPRIGDTLTGSLVGGNNSGSLTYIWKSGPSELGRGISYTVLVTDLGKTITLEITSNVETGTRTSAATTAVKKKVGPAAPAMPEFVSKSHNSVTLTANPQYEFSKDNTDWQGNVFDNLTANTTYSFYQRVKETSDTEASSASTALSVKTDPAPASPISGAAKIDKTSPRIGDTLTGSVEGGSNSGTLTYKWKSGASDLGTGTSYTVLERDLGNTITLEITSSVETGTLTSTPTAAVLKKTAPTAPGKPALAEKSHNSVRLTANPSYEFSQGGTDWQTSNEFTGLDANTPYSFYQRVKETSDTYESAASTALQVTTDPVPPTQDNIDITAAKSAVESATFAAVDMTQLNTQAQAKAYVEGIIGGLSLSGVTAVIEDDLFTPALGGTAENQSGTDGSYVFKVTLSKGTGLPQTTAEITLSITAKPVRMFTITLSAGAGGSIVSGAGKYAEGSPATIVASAGEEYVFVGWYEGSQKISTAASYEFSVTKDRNLQAQFVHVNEPVFDGRAWHIAAGADESRLILEGELDSWTVEYIFADPGIRDLLDDTTEPRIIIVSPEAQTFTAIARLKSPDGTTVRYVGIEKEVNVTAGTFDKSTWIIPADCDYDVEMDMRDWIIVNSWSDVKLETDLTAVGETQKISVAGSSDSFSAIIKLRSRIGNRTKLIGIERRR